MKLGQVIEKERRRKNLSIERVAAQLGISEGEYREIEGGKSDIEKWGPLLGNIAIELAAPTSRLLAASGRAADTKPSQAGQLIQHHRENKSKPPSEMQRVLSITEEEYAKIERGQSPIETWGPLLLRFAEIIEQPVFNLLYPCGLPAGELTDYP